MTENWLPVVGYEDLYEVSDLGNVRSLDRVTTDSIGRSRPYAGQLISPTLRDDDIPPYYAVGLHRNGRAITRRVHVLVLAAFVGPRPAANEVRHLNGDGLDNRLTNLAYGTPSENQLDNVRLGTHFNAAKDACKWGHEFTPENIARDRSGHRHCKSCNARHARNYRLKTAQSVTP